MNSYKTIKIIFVEQIFFFLINIMYSSILKTRHIKTIKKVIIYKIHIILPALFFIYFILVFFMDCKQCNHISKTDQNQNIKITRFCINQGCLGLKRLCCQTCYNTFHQSHQCININSIYHAFQNKQNQKISDKSLNVQSFFEQQIQRKILVNVGNKNSQIITSQLKKMYQCQIQEVILNSTIQKFNKIQRKMTKTLSNWKYHLKDQYDEILLTLDKHIFEDRLQQIFEQVKTNGDHNLKRKKVIQIDIFNKQEKSVQQKIQNLRRLIDNVLKYKYDDIQIISESIKILNKIFLDFSYNLQKNFYKLMDTLESKYKKMEISKYYEINQKQHSKSKKQSQFQASIAQKIRISQPLQYEPQQKQNNSFIKNPLNFLYDTSQGVPTLNDLTYKFFAQKKTSFNKEQNPFLKKKWLSRSKINDSGNRPFTYSNLINWQLYFYLRELVINYQNYFNIWSWNSNKTYLKKLIIQYCNDKKKLYQQMKTMPILNSLEIQWIQLGKKQQITVMLDIIKNKSYPEEVVSKIHPSEKQNFINNQKKLENLIVNCPNQIDFTFIDNLQHFFGKIQYFSYGYNIFLGLIYTDYYNCFPQSQSSLNDHFFSFQQNLMLLKKCPKLKNIWISQIQNEQKLMSTLQKRGNNPNLNQKALLNHIVFGNNQPQHKQLQFSEQFWIFLENYLNKNTQSLGFLKCKLNSKKLSTIIQKNLSALNTLYFENCDDLNDSVLEHISKNCRGLKLIQFAILDCKNPDLFGVHLWSLQTRYISVLILKNCKFLIFNHKSRQFIQTFKKMSYLVYLNLYGSNINNQGVEIIVNLKNTLKQLNLGLTCITYECIDNLTQMKKLQGLDLRETSLNMQSLLVIVKKLQNLRKFSIYPQKTKIKMQSQSDSQYFIGQIIANLHKATHVAIGNVNEIKSNILTDLVKKCTKQNKSLILKYICLEDVKIEPALIQIIESEGVKLIMRLQP